MRPRLIEQFAFMPAWEQQLLRSIFGDEVDRPTFGLYGCEPDDNLEGTHWEVVRSSLRPYELPDYEERASA